MLVPPASQAVLPPKHEQGASDLEPFSLALALPYSVFALASTGTSTSTSTSPSISITLSLQGDLSGDESSGTPELQRLDPLRRPLIGPASHCNCNRNCGCDLCIGIHSLCHLCCLERGQSAQNLPRHFLFFVLFSSASASVIVSNAPRLINQFVSHETSHSASQLSQNAKKP